MYLVEADGVGLEGEVGEDDKAAEGGAQRQDSADGHLLDVEEAQRRKDTQAEEGDDKVHKGEQVSCGQCGEGDVSKCTASPLQIYTIAKVVMLVDVFVEKDHADR